MLWVSQWPPLLIGFWAVAQCPCSAISIICYLLAAFFVFLNVPVSISCKWKLVTGKICPWHLRPICLHQCEESSCSGASAQGSLLFLCSHSSMIWISSCAHHNKDGPWHLILTVVLHSDTLKLLASEMTSTFFASVLLKLLSGYCGN